MRFCEQHFNRCLSYHCGIETCMNRGNNAFGSLCLSYHCGIETNEQKLAALGNTLVFIVPLWNWNQLKLFTIEPPKLVFIVPLWNWNTDENMNAYTITLVFIVPLWNWNMVWGIHDDWPKRGVYRTIVELKRNYQTHEILYVFRCLSYHCGIETSFPVLHYSFS